MKHKINDQNNNATEYSGEETFSDNATYKGSYVSGKKHGKGTYTWADWDGKNTYTGDFVEDQLEGKGEQKWTDGLCYFGEWK